MGLFDTIKNALGLQRPVVPRDPDTPLQIDTAAREHLESLPDGQGLHIELRPADPGFAVQVHEGDSYGPPPPQLAPLPITISDPDLHRLRGLVLVHRDGRWAVSVDLDLRARETPNPNGRQYLCDRWLADGRPMFFAQGVAAPWLAKAMLALDGVQSVLFRDNTLTIERTPDFPWDRMDLAVDAALREYFLRCGHELSSTDLPKREDPFEEDVWRVIEERVLPGIHRDGGDMELVGIDDGVVRVSMHGACRGCPASTATLRMGVEQALKQAFPGQIERVEQV